MSDWAQVLEVASYAVTVIGLPFVFSVFWTEQRKERENEQAYQLLSNAYNEFLKVVLAHPDLQLRTARGFPHRPAAADAGRRPGLRRLHRTPGSGGIGLSEGPFFDC